MIMDMPAPRVYTDLVACVRMLSDDSRSAELIDQYHGLVREYSRSTDRKHQFKLRKAWISRHTQLRHILDEATATKLVGG